MERVAIKPLPRPLPGRRFTLAAAASLAVFLAVAARWGWTRGAWFSVGFHVGGDHLSLFGWRDGVSFARVRGERPDDPVEWWVFQPKDSKRHYLVILRNAWSKSGVGWSASGGGAIFIPGEYSFSRGTKWSEAAGLLVRWWVPLAASALLPAAWAVRIALLRRRASTRAARRVAGHCVGCGYDLRASPARCPECGVKAE